MPPLEMRGEGKRCEVLDECERQRQALRLGSGPAAHLVECQPERRSVRRVEREPGRRPPARSRDELPEQRDVRVVEAEESRVERFERGPGEGGSGSSCCCAKAAHRASLPLPCRVRCPRATPSTGPPHGSRCWSASRSRRARRIPVRGSSVSPSGSTDGRSSRSTAHGKNLVLRFDGGIVVRSHLRVSGRWTVRPRGQTSGGTPWLVLRGGRVEAVLWNGPVLELHTRALARLGPDILEQPPRIDEMLDRLRAADSLRWFGELLLDQQVVAGIGNMWLAEALWTARLSPWRRLGDVGEHERRAALETAATMMRAAVDGGRAAGRQVYRRVGRPCPRCRTPIRSYGQGDDNRIDLLVPGLPERNRPARRVTHLCGSQGTAPLRVASWLLSGRVRRRTRCPGAVRVRGAHDARRSLALRVPAARSRFRRGAVADPPSSARRARRDRRSQARTGCSDLRACACRPLRDGRRRALPLDSRADADVDGRALRRLRLERRSVRRRVPGPRANALRQRANLRCARAGRRALGGQRHRSRRRDHAPPDRRGRDLAALAGGTGSDAAGVRP